MDTTITVRGKGDAQTHFERHFACSMTSLYLCYEVIVVNFLFIRIFFFFLMLMVLLCLVVVCD
jgi:hypothetical protein